MTPAKFLSAKNLIIAFPGGAGGAHLANMISLCSEFDLINNLADYVKYDAYITGPDSVKQHSKNAIFPNAHMGKLQNFRALFHNKNYLKVLNNKNLNICILHEWEIKELLRDDQLDILKDPIWIVMKSPHLNETATNRMLKMDMPTNINMKHNYNWPYSVNNIELANDDNGFHFLTDDLFTQSGSNILRECLQNNWGITLPVEADAMHALWLKWIKL